MERLKGGRIRSRYNGATFEFRKDYGWKGRPTAIIYFDKYKITLRQLEFLRLRALGYTKEEIAEELKTKRGNVNNLLHLVAKTNNISLPDFTNILIGLRLLNPFAIIGIKKMFDIPFDNVDPVDEKKILKFMEQSKIARKGRIKSANPRG